MLIKVRCLLDVTIPKRFNHIVDFLKQKFSVVLPVTDGSCLGDGHVLWLSVLFPIHELEFVLGPVAFVVMSRIVVLHRDRDDAFVVLIKYFLRLLFDLVVIIVTIFVDASDTFRSVGKGSFDESVLRVVFIGEQTLYPCRFQHGGFCQIASGIVFAVDDVRTRRFPLCVEMLDAVLSDRILSDDLLNGTLQSHIAGILIVRCGIHVEHLDSARLVLVQCVRYFDISDVGHRV